MNYELIAAAVYMCSVIVNAYYFIEMGLLKDRVYSTMCFIPIWNTFFALCCALGDLYWWVRGRYGEIKYYFIKKFNTWIIIRFSKIQKDLIKFYGVEKYKQVVLSDLERLSKEI